jgi:tripartite-type tricarboxylate transporter receptor subunit TctC
LRGTACRFQAAISLISHGGRGDTSARQPRHSAAHRSRSPCLASCIAIRKLDRANDTFYQGKTIAIVCGFTTGGGYDGYARLLARHIGAHIPGRPAVVVQNMAGAGSVRAANHVYVNGPKDGTMIAAVNQNVPMYQLLGGQAAQFDAAKLRWIGSLITSNSAIYTWHASKTRTIEDAKKRETPLGGAGTTSDSYIYPTLLNKLIGTRFKIVGGYPGGTSELHIAMERGEIDGRSGGGTIPSLLANNKSWLDEKKLNFLVQIGAKRDPYMSTAPLMSDLVTSEGDKRVVEVVTLPTILGYGYWLAPEVPSDRIEILRKAFDATIASEAFRAEAAKLRMPLEPQSGSTLSTLVARAAAVPQETRTRTARLLEWIK